MKNIEISGVVVPKGTEITFTGTNHRKHRGKLAKSYPAWVLDINRSTKTTIKFIEPPIKLPEKRKRIYLGGYVLITDMFIFKVQSEYFIENDHSLFNGTGVYEKYDNVWTVSDSRSWYASETKLHHSKIIKSFKDEESLNKFLMLENL